MKRVFVCSPFRGDVAANVALARAACRQVLVEGDAPFAPHLVYPEILDDAVPADRERGIAAGLAWLAVADELLVVGQPTEGMRRELAAAEALGLPVRRAMSVAVPTPSRGSAPVDPLRQALATVVADWGALLVIALLMLIFFLCPGCVATTCEASCSVPTAR